MENKSVILYGDTYGLILKTMKDFVSRDDSRPILKNIKLDIRKDKIRAVACDGYKLCVFDINYDHPEQEEFVCYIQPSAIPKGIIEVEIKIDNNKMNTIFRLQNGESITYTKTNIIGEFVDENNVLPPVNENLSVALNATYLSKIASSVKNFNGNVKVFFNEDARKPITFKAKMDSFGEITAIQLPVMNL